MNNIDETKKIDENLINKFAPKVVEGYKELVRKLIKSLCTPTIIFC